MSKSRGNVVNPGECGTRAIVARGFEDSTRGVVAHCRTPALTASPLLGNRLLMASCRFPIISPPSRKPSLDGLVPISHDLPAS
eukprot:scaffold159670_cov32-Tisochrysis_lutea.AAC.5